MTDFQCRECDLICLLEESEVLHNRIYCLECYGEKVAEEVAIMLCKTCDKEWFIRESDLISDDVVCSDCGEDERLKREWL